MRGTLFFFIALATGMKLLALSPKEAAPIFLVICLVNLWSYGIMHNFKHDPQSAPNFATAVNMLSTFAILGFFVYQFTLTELNVEEFTTVISLILIPYGIYKTGRFIF